jgi:anti-sigma factor RsiW
MDGSLQHAFDAEQIMAYLDGELEPQRAAALAAHLVGCGECREVAKGLRAVSERMLNLEVEPPSAGISDTVFTALDLRNSPSSATADHARYRTSWNWRRLFARPRAWAIAGAAAMVAILVIGIPSALRQRTVAIHGRNVDGLERLEQTDVDSAVISPAPAAQPAAKGKLPVFGGSLGDHATTSVSVDGRAVDDELHAPETVGPMIAQTASLSIVAANYDEASAAIDGLATAHGGYVEKLDAKAQTGSGRELSAALRIPAKQLDGFLADLRKLGHVEEESRENEEVSAPYVDLQARLKNARATEQRLIELLGTRTGKLSDVLDAERELARIRGEIEGMRGQNAVLVHRVSYATVQVELSEVYRERLSRTAKGTKIWNALVEGFANLEDGAVSVLVFLLAYGPSILFWLAVLMLPAWLVWRRLRPREQA